MIRNFLADMLLDQGFDECAGDSLSRLHSSPVPMQADTCCAGYMAEELRAGGRIDESTLYEICLVKRTPRMHKLQ